MKLKIIVGLLFYCSVLGQTQTTQTPLNTTILTDSGALQKRAIRRSIPLTNSIEKAYRSGTRDTSGRPGPNYWQSTTDYTINASLNPDTQTITGSETIALHNNSPDKLDRIVLRLDPNIFRPRVPRGFSVPAETTEGMIVTRIKINGTEIDLKATPPRQTRQDQQPKVEKSYVTDLDQTVAAVVLAQPIDARSAATIEIDWSTKLPGGEGGQGHRMTQRWESKLFQPTQWYPRVAKYDDLRGWDTNIYLGPSEFYNNFGRFDVRIEVPAGWLVSGTGVLQNASEALAPFVRERLAAALKTDEEVMIIKEDERGASGKALLPREKNVWHFVAEEVNDFAWATSNQTVWRSTRANIPNKGYVPVHMFYLPERANLFKDAGKNARHALEFYSKLLIPYSFPQLTLQDGPSAGMEYPMVINSNQGAADHETFHEWIPMTVGTNETRYGWMDEGFNQYANILSAADTAKKPFSIDNLGQRYGSISGSEDEPMMMWNANHGGEFYRFQTYGKTPLMFSMLGGVVGDDRMNAAIKKYVETWKFKHPSPWDFAFFMNRELNRDLNWFWYYWLFTTEAVNGSIKNVATQGDKTQVTIHQAGEMPSPVVLKVEFADGREKIKSMPNAQMIDAKNAIVRWSEDVWFNSDRDFQAALDFGKRKINKITLDPYGRFPDSDIGDNVWTSK